MKVNMQFPKCPNCNTSDSMSFHRNCSRSGTSPLQFDTIDNTVYCADCGANWGIYSSNYYCRCNHTFKAVEVEIEIRAIIEVAKLVAFELLRKQELQGQINETTGKSVGKWIKGFLEGTSLNLGYAVGRIVGVVMKIFGL